MRPLEPRPDVPAPRPAAPRQALVWGAAAVVLVVVVASHLLYLVVTARGGESGSAFSWFVNALLTPAFGYAAWRCARRAVAATRRPAPPTEDPEPRGHTSLQPGADPPPRRW